MINNYQANRQLLDLLAEHKLVIITGTQYTINPNFRDLFNSNLKHLTPAHAVTRSIDMYCYTASVIEKTLLAGAFTQILNMTTGCQDIARIIKKQIQNTPGPKDRPGELQHFLKELNEEKLLK